MKQLERSFYAKSALDVAPRLLNKVLVARGVSGRIVEVEAYMGADDAASHAFRGPTPRTEVMFGPPGFLYVYFTYGMHFCCNVVCSRDGVASAVLIRALEPLSGLDDMRRRRSLRAVMTDKQLTSGPAKLCQALSIDRADNGADLTAADRGIYLADDGMRPPKVPMAGPRVGIRQAADLPWRFWVQNDPNVSK